MLVWTETKVVSQYLKKKYIKLDFPLTPLRYSSYNSGDQSDDCWSPSDLSLLEEEQESLRQSLRSLQTQLANERARREGAERDADLLANDNVVLEQRLGMMAGCQVRKRSNSHRA